MSTANNPQIAVITHMEKKIIDSLDDAEYLKSLRQIYMLIQLIREVHREDALLTKLKEEYNFLISKKSDTKLKEYAKTRLFLYADWYGEAMEILYSKGYLTDSGYKMVYPSDLIPQKNAYKSPLLDRP